MLGIDILLGLPFYYLLCFVGIAEESEAEIAGLCTMLGFAIHLLNVSDVEHSGGDRSGSRGDLLTRMSCMCCRACASSSTPFAVTFTWKSANFEPALVTLPPSARNSIRQKLGPSREWTPCSFASIEFERADAATLSLLDPERCLAIARRLLGTTPTPDQIKKATHLLNLI